MAGRDIIDTGGGPKTRSLGARIYRVVETVVVWLLALGILGAIGYGVWWTVRDAMPTDRLLVVERQVPADPEWPRDGPAEGGLSAPYMTDGQAITNPSWAARPLPDYPDAALRDGIDGEATLSCRADAAGTLRACRVVAETPPGKGFGAASLDAASRARLVPRTVDGRADNSAVRFTVRYRMAPPVYIPILPPVAPR